MIPEYKDHPIAELFPLMSESELQELAEDIRANGQREDIIVYQARILDGRNRYRACLLADVMPRFKQYVGTEPIKAVLSWNLHRRHLTTSQRAAAATDALPLLEKQAEERRLEGAKKGATIGGRGRPGKTPDQGWANLPTGNPVPDRHRARTDAATLLNVSSRSVATAKRVQQEAPELLEKVKAGEMTLNAADQQVKQAKRKKKEEARPVYNFRVLAIHPDWNMEYKTLRRLELPDTEESFHAFVVVPNERVSDGFFLFRDWFGVPPSCAISVKREDVVDVDGVGVSNLAVFYAPIGEPEWTGKGKPDTSEEASLSVFWQKVTDWTEGPRVSIGFTGEGFKCLPL